MIVQYKPMKILISYATISGMTMLVAEAVQEFLQGQNFEVDLVDMEQLEPQDLKKYDLILLGSSTYNDGGYNDVSELFFQKLRDADVDLSSVKCALFGLGDTYYTHFATVVDLMKKELEVKKATVHDNMIKVDGFPDEEKLDEVRNWVKVILQDVQAKK